MSAESRSIHIRPSGSAFDVVIVPPVPWNGADRHGLITHRAAKRAADFLAIVHGWKVIDDTPTDRRGVA